MEAQLISNITTVWALGRNYSDHAKEMGSETPKEPVVFLKSPACLTQSEQIRLPSWSNEVHHELEIAVRVGRNNTPSHIALALDLTARDKQKQLKEARLPWALAKSFTQSCPMSPMIDYKGKSWFEDLTFELAVNDTIRQFGKTQDMVFDLESSIAFLESYFPLREGDLLLTGTPSGVGVLESGDKLHGEIPGVLKMNWSIC